MGTQAKRTVARRVIWVARGAELYRIRYRTQSTGALSECTEAERSSSTLAPRTRSVLNFTLMHRIGRSIRQGPDSDDETAHEARICMLGCPETRKWCINALSAAELGQWVPRGPYTQAQAT